MSEIGENDGVGQQSFDRKSEDSPDDVHIDINSLKNLPPLDYYHYLVNISEQVNASVIAEHLDSFIDRFTQVAEDDTSESWRDQTVNKLLVGHQTSSLLEKILEDHEIRIDKERIERMYDLRKSDSYFVWKQATLFTDSLLQLDERNRGNDEEYINLESKIEKEFIECLLTPELNNEYHIFEIIDSFTALPSEKWNRYGDLLRGVLQESLKHELSPASFKVMTEHVVDILGLEEAKSLVRLYAEADPELQDNANSFMQYYSTPSGEIVNSVTDLYQKAEVEMDHEYKPLREVEDYEGKLLKDQLKNTQTILDIGCGSGRIMEYLQSPDKTIYGIDIVPSYIDQIKKRDPSAQVFLESWSDTHFDDGSIDAAYCLGRSFLHNTTTSQARLFFREAGRILSDDGENDKGFLLLDTPDPDMGQYEINREAFSSNAEQKGIQYYNIGSVTDSPDGIHFIDRIAYYPAQLKGLALLEGFNMEMIGQTEYEGIDGNMNRNLYWKFTKRNQELTWRERMDMENELSELIIKYGRLPGFTMIDFHELDKIAENVKSD